MSRQSNSYSGTVLGFFRPVVGCVRTMGRYHGPRPTRSACVQHGAGAVGGHLAARLAAHGSAAGIEVAAVALRGPAGSDAGHADPDRPGLAGCDSGVGETQWRSST